MGSVPVGSQGAAALCVEVVPETGIEPVRPLFTKAADFKSDVSTNFTTGAKALLCLQLELF